MTPDFYLRADRAILPKGLVLTLRESIAKRYWEPLSGATTSAWCLKIRGTRSATSPVPHIFTDNPSSRSGSTNSVVIRNLPKVFSKWLLLFYLGLFAGPVGCLNEIQLADPENTVKTEIGETRKIELRYLRFEVSNFEKTLTLEDMLEMPEALLNRMWLFDMDISGGTATPGMVEYNLEAIKALDPETLSPAERNMQKLLTMTPDTVDFTDTKMEEMMDMAPLLGIAPGQIVADLLDIDTQETMLSSDDVAKALSELLISTHPNARWRPGPITPEHPDGQYRVREGAMPITLGDTLHDLATLSKRFGPYAKDGVFHPGFVVGEPKAKFLTDDFRITFRTSANTLPFRGVDLSNVTEAGVNSIPTDIHTTFDFDDPDFMVVEGLTDAPPAIESITMRITEDDKFIPGGTLPIPMGQGNSSGWLLAPWKMERIFLGAAQRRYGDHDCVLSYKPPGRSTPLVEATIVDGWESVFVAGDVGAPPAPGYLWDMILEVSQIRLHDGGIPEGEADVEFTLRDLPIGMTVNELEQAMMNALKADPTILSESGADMLDNTYGFADFYYYRAKASNPPETSGDWLFFITEDDIPFGDTGGRVRLYHNYKHVGFYSDADLKERISSNREVDRDTSHQKLRIKPGRHFYAADDDGAVYRIEVGEKPLDTRITLSITREK